MKKYDIYLLLAAIVMASLDVDAQSGVVNIESVPNGAKVIIGGKTMGITPYKLQVSAGQYSVRLERLNYMPRTLMVNVEAGGNGVITEVLEPEKVNVTIRESSGIYNPIYYLDDDKNRLGASRWSGGISPGRHIIYAKINSDIIVKDVTIPVGKDTTIVFFTRGN